MKTLPNFYLGPKDMQNWVRFVPDDHITWDNPWWRCLILGHVWHKELQPVPGTVYSEWKPTHCERCQQRATHWPISQ